MNIQEAYDDWSTTYDTDENRTRDLDRVVTEKTLANWQGKLILELGCGTGKNAHLLSQIGENVHALDGRHDFSRQGETEVQQCDTLHVRGTMIIRPLISSFATLSLST